MEDIVSNNEEEEGKLDWTYIMCGSSPSYKNKS